MWIAGRNVQQVGHKIELMVKRSRHLRLDTLSGFQRRWKTSVPLVPPKPNELDIAVLTGISRAVFGA